MKNKDVKEQGSDVDLSFSLLDFMTKCLAQWKWILLSVIFFCFIGAWSVVSKQPVYSRSMEVLIKDQDNAGGVGDIANAFSSFGLVSSNTKVKNELISLTSPAILYNVVARLGLDVNYSTPGRFHEKTLYGSNLPYLVAFKDLEEQQDAGFTINIGSDGQLSLSEFYWYTSDGKEEFDKEIKVKPGFEDIKTPIGNIVISPNGKYVPSKGKKAKKIEKIEVVRDGMQTSVETYSDKIQGDLADIEADVIDLTMEDVSIERAVDVLDAIIAVYNENWINDKNKISVATSRFIDDRLAFIEKELNVVDSDISKFKSEHKVPNVEEAAKLQMKQSSEVSTQMLEITNQMSMAVYLRDYLKNPNNVNNVIPVNTGIASPALETQISAYNNLLLNRNNLAANSSAANPLVEEYDAQLKGLRLSIVSAIDGQIAALNTSLKNMKGAKGSIDSMLESGPTQAKYLLSIERQQYVKSSLYLYLLQKREENELTQKFTADNIRIITPPTGSLKPIAPKAKIIMGVAFILGLLLPMIVIYIKEATNSKVRSRRDLDGMKAPFVGEIPYVGRKSFKERFGKLLPEKKKSSRELETVKAAVSEGSRDVISESFRIMRGNLDFMNRNKDASNVILVTSFNPGSGKSFISYNLAASFALKGKKVLLVDGDLRHGSVSQFVNMPTKGLTNYLTGNVQEWNQFAVPVKDHSNMYVMPIGNRPPNPAELIENGKFATFIEEARKEFDYILLDCPPTDVVVDTQLMEQYADRTVFVVRAGLLDVKQIAEIDNIYTSKRFKQMSVVLNGTTGGGKSKSYGAYGYYGGE